MKTDNYQKHTSKNPLKQFFVWNFFRIFNNQLKDLKIETILDAGCGEGFTLAKLKEKGIGKKFTGVDASKDAIELSKKINPDLSLDLGNIYKLPFKDKSFDLVLCTEVFEHLDNSKKALKELARVSKKYIFLSVPNEPLFFLMNYTQWGIDIGHINHWTYFGFKMFV